MPAGASSGRSCLPRRPTPQHPARLAGRPVTRLFLLMAVLPTRTTPIRQTGAPRCRLRAVLHPRGLGVLRPAPRPRKRSEASRQERLSPSAEGACRSSLWESPALSLQRPLRGRADHGPIRDSGHFRVSVQQSPNGLTVPLPSPVAAAGPSGEGLGTLAVYLLRSVRGPPSVLGFGVCKPAPVWD